MATAFPVVLIGYRDRIGAMRAWAYGPVGRIADVRDRASQERRAYNTAHPDNYLAEDGYLEARLPEPPKEVSVHG